MNIQEWKSDNPHGKLELPAEVIARLRYRVLVEILNKKSITCWCETVDHEPMIQSLTLKHVLFDTSDRYNGITLCARRTLFPEVQYLGQFTATVLPITERELG